MKHNKKKYNERFSKERNVRDQSKIDPMVKRREINDFLNGLDKSLDSLVGETVRETN